MNIPNLTEGILNCAYCNVPTRGVIAEAKTKKHITCCPKCFEVYKKKNPAHKVK